MKKSLCVLFSVFLLITGLFPCTSAVITGNASLTGRPMLWKHRDTGALENKIVHFMGDKYACTGIFNVNDTLNQQLWMGSNEAGFSIMNTASYNVNAGVEWKKQRDQEGLFMKKALGQCATVDEFETFLKSQSGKWGVEANFGVIDAKGGAAYFETGFYDYVKYDASDKKIAPEGYLIRTNFSFSGEPEDGQGYIRYAETADLFRREMLKGGLSVEFILKKATRNMHHGLMKRDIWDTYFPEDFQDEYMVSLQDYVVRYWSASVLIVEGVKPHENPEATTLWTVIGFPLTCVVTPVWVGGGKELPATIQSTDGGNPPLVDWSLKLKEYCFPYEKGNGEAYINTAPLKNQQNTGFLQNLIPREDAIILKARTLQEQFYKKGVNQKDIKYFNTWLDGYIRSLYESSIEQLGHP
jgi:hypothetical protein